MNPRHRLRKSGPITTPFFWQKKSLIRYRCPFRSNVFWLNKTFCKQYTVAFTSISLYSMSFTSDRLYLVDSLKCEIDLYFPVCCFSHHSSGCLWSVRSSGAIISLVICHFHPEWLVTLHIQQGVQLSSLGY